LLTRRIGNPFLSGVESGCPAITGSRVDHDYFLMTAYWEEQQPLCYPSRRAARSTITGPEPTVSNAPDGPPGVAAPPKEIAP
jgi:hypothetical protein